uniref:Core domain-containing protein n=1 Tax=Oryza sativa subsp. japonica TaxID=39947 RepID=Q6Z252_ORYSJ|nr:hypothetical protein [Oryza sativa Japonica Group]BAD03542.1 hypothetical protein [Oryza sativa Japonica Group]
MAASSSSSRPLLRRVAALLGGRVRASHRLLSSSPSSSSAAAAATERASPPSPADPDTVHMTDGCIRRLKELHAKEPPSEGKMLRLSVEAGGCSGFQYSFSLDDKKNSDDRIFEKEGVKLVVDDVSYDFVKGATVDYEEELIRSAFVVSLNLTYLILDLNTLTMETCLVKSSAGYQSS